jgi:large subunit ribosomal protein L25
MAQTTLLATTGRPTGSPAARRLRAEGHIPGIIYGQGMSPMALSVERRDLRLAIAGPAGFNTLLSLSVDGKKYPAIIKEIQRHPIRRTVSHIDFLQVSMTEEISLSVPVRLEGEAKAVLSADGMVDPSVDSIDVVCTPGNMPAEIVIDVSAMQPGDVIRLGDLTMAKGVTATGDPDMPVVTTMMSAGSAPSDSGDAVDSGDADADAGDAAASDEAAGDAEGE